MKANKRQFLGDEDFIGTCRSVQVKVKVKRVVERKIMLSWISVMLLWVNVIVVKLIYFLNI